MFYFGLGTMPTLFLFGSAANLLSVPACGRMLQLAGVMVAMTRGYSLYRAMRP